MSCNYLVRVINPDKFHTEEGEPVIHKSVAFSPPQENAQRERERERERESKSATAECQNISDNPLANGLLKVKLKKHQVLFSTNASLLTL
jgi:hypothetical protein